MDDVSRARIAEYHLKFQRREINGMIINVGEGYAILQPWPELGDPGRAEILNDLRSSRRLPLVRRSLDLAQIDGEARQLNYSLLPEPSAVPVSHLLLDINCVQFERDLKGYLEEGIQLFKIKVGKDLSTEKLRIEAAEKFSECPFRWRIDVNQRLNFEAAKNFFGSLSERILSRIDFIEDPLAGTPAEWEKFKNEFGVRIAHDFAGEEWREVSDVWVLKPTRTRPDELVERAAKTIKRIVITSGIEHELGYLCAFAEAARLKLLHPLLIDECGLLSFEQIEGLAGGLFRRGNLPDFSPLMGLGYGADAILEKLTWRNLN